MHKAVFLDRDGTINEDIGDLYSAQKLVFIPGVFAALRYFAQHFLLFIVTNQAAMGSGVYTKKQFAQFNRRYLDVLARQGIQIQKVYCCPHRPQDKCFCRKPSPYFIHKAQKEFDLDLKHSWFIGDHPSDVEAGIRAGLKSIYVLTGHGQKHRKDMNQNTSFVARDLAHAAQWVKQLPKQNHARP